MRMHPHTFTPLQPEAHSSIPLETEFLTEQGVGKKEGRIGKPRWRPRPLVPLEVGRGAHPRLLTGLGRVVTGFTAPAQALVFLVFKERLLCSDRLSALRSESDPPPARAAPLSSRKKTSRGCGRFFSSLLNIAYATAPPPDPRFSEIMKIKAITAFARRVFCVVWSISVVIALRIVFLLQNQYYSPARASSNNACV